MRRRWGQNIQRSLAALAGIGAVLLLTAADAPQNGQGAYTYPNGEKYTGEFRDGKYNGQGTLTSPGGGSYAGGFLDGKFNGQGTYSYPNGENNEHANDYKQRKYKQRKYKQRKYKQQSK